MMLPEQVLPAHLSKPRRGALASTEQ